MLKQHKIIMCVSGRKSDMPEQNKDARNRFAYYMEIQVTDLEDIDYTMSLIENAYHACVVKQKNNGNSAMYPVSLPECGHTYQEGVGSCFRIFCDNENDLKKLNLPEALSSIIDYINISSIKHIPDDVKYAIFRRYRFNSASHRERFASKCRKRIKEPHINVNLYNKPCFRLTSGSTSQHMTYYVDYEIVNGSICEGKIGSFGFNNKTTKVAVPMW